MKNAVKLGAVIAALLALAACGKPDAPLTTTTAPTRPDWPAALTETYREDETEIATQTEWEPPATTVVITNSSKPTAMSRPPASSTSQLGSSAPKPSSSASQVTTVPPLQVVSVSIPEGFTFYQAAQRLEASGVCSAKAFYDAAQSYQVQSFAAPFSPDSCYHYEGYLFPDTYEFYLGDDPEAVLRKMLNNYAAKSGLPDYDTLILASIIERETRSSEHMAMVSSVFHNRLDQNMRLQADATIAYVEKHIKPNPLVRNPGQYAERYNTYKCAALPVGPICNPSRRAIEAALHPSRSDYLYYFFGKDSTNHYSVTYEEHEAAMARYGVQS